MSLVYQKRPRRVRYRLGLAAMVSLLVAGAVALVAWANLANTRGAIVDLTDQQVRDLLIRLDSRVQDRLEDAAAAARLSERLMSNQVLKDAPDLLARHFTEILRANPTFAWASYSDASGNFTGAYRAPDGSLHISQTSVKHLGHAGTAWEHHYEAQADDYDPRDEEFYKAAQKAGKLVWVGPVIFYDEGLPGITCANPRYAKDGRLLGVLTVDFNLNFLSDFVASLHFGKHGKVFMFDQAMHVIAFPGLRLIETTGQRAAGKLLTEGDVNDPVFQAFLRRPETRDPSILEEQFGLRQDGQRYIAGYRPLKLAGGPTWFLGAYAPESDFLSALDRNRREALAIAIAALGLGLFLTLLLARRITIPLTRLASEMQEVGDFKLTLRPPMPTVFKEVAAMDESLLAMKGSLRSFSYYVPRDLVRSMLQSGQEATLQGQTRELTVYFSDIAGMTSLAESMPPDQLVQLLSRYFDEMTGLIAAQDGTVDKFIGDAIMAFWGAPAPSADHAARACEAALRSQRRLAELRSAPEANGLGKIHARIGIATGPALVGNVGSHDRFNYTAMGDTVNLASRLESLNKLYGTAILISDPTYQAARESIVARPVGVVQVKGKHQAVAVWEPLALASEDDEIAREMERLFTQGLAAYTARDFSEAAEHYKAALRLRPADKPAAVLLELSREFLSAPPPQEWNGVYVAREK